MCHTRYLGGNDKYVALNENKKKKKKWKCTTHQLPATHVLGFTKLAGWERKELHM